MQIIIDENMPFASELFADLGEVIRLPGRKMSAEQVAAKRGKTVQEILG